MMTSPPFLKPQTMNVDFNGVRKSLCRTHDRLIAKLNRSIIMQDQFATPNELEDDRRTVNIKNYVLIDASEIDELLNDMRFMIGTVAACYDEDDPNFQDVYEQVYPAAGDKRMAEFNPESENEEPTNTAAT